jgi:hypothetical protein
MVSGMVPKPALIVAAAVLPVILGVVMTLVAKVLIALIFV